MNEAMCAIAALGQVFCRGIINFKTAGLDGRPDTGKNLIRSCAMLLHCHYGMYGNLGDCATPAGMHGGNDSHFRVGQQDRGTVRHAHAHAGTINTHEDIGLILMHTALTMAYENVRAMYLHSPVRHTRQISLTNQGVYVVRHIFLIITQPRT